MRKWTGEIKSSGAQSLFQFLVSGLGSKAKEVEVDLPALAADLSTLDSREAITIYNIILDYWQHNKEQVKKMGGDRNFPYNAKQKEEGAEMDLKEMPDNLIIMLHQYIFVRKQARESEKTS